MRRHSTAAACAAAAIAVVSFWTSTASALTFTTSSVVVTDNSFSPTLTFVSVGLNNDIVLGTPLNIPDFIVGTITGTSNSDTSGTISAVFTFTNPSSNSTTDSGTITANFASHNLKEIDVTWADPISLIFADGSKLQIDLSDAQTNCTGNCGNGDKITIGGTFTLLNGPTVSQTPLPAALPLFASGFGAIGLLLHRRKKRAAFNT